MPIVTPMVPESTITRTQSTQMPSAKLSAQTTPTELQPPQQTTTPQTISEGSVKPEEKTDTDPTRLKALLAKEKEHFTLRKQLEKLKREIDLEKENSRKWSELNELSQKDKLQALQKLGISYEDLTQQILNNGEIPPAQIAKMTAEEIATSKFEEYKKQQEDMNKTLQQKQYDDTIKHIESEVRFIVDRDDKFPLVKANGSYEDVVKWIVEEFHRTGRITPVEDALSRWEGDALKGFEELAKIDKIRALFTSKEQPKPQQASSPQTLSQRATAPIPSPRPMSDAERKQRAIDAFYGRLS